MELSRTDIAKYSVGADAFRFGGILGVSLQ